MARRILRSIQLDKIAAVDRPCQEGAVVAILKRAPEEKELVSQNVDRKKNLVEKMLLAKTGLAIVKTLAITKEWDESKHPRAKDGEFGAGGGGGGESGGAEEKPKQRVLRALRVLAKVGKWATLGLSAASLGIAGATLLTSGPAIVGVSAVFMATSYAVGSGAFKLVETALSSVIEKALSKPLQQRLAALTPEQMVRLGQKLVGMMTDEQASKFADKLEEINGKIASKIKKAWSDASREAAAKARMGAALHRDKANSHDKAGRKIPALKHQIMADHYEHAAQHFDIGNIAAGREKIDTAHQALGLSPAPELSFNKKENTRRNPRPIPNNSGARGKQSSEASVREFRTMGPINMGKRVSKDQLERFVAKSAIILSNLPDPAAHVRKVIGNKASDYITDFVNSDNPKFKGKSKAERIRMALGAYYSNQ